MSYLLWSRLVVMLPPWVQIVFVGFIGIELNQKCPPAVSRRPDYDSRRERIFATTKLAQKIKMPIAT
jgi:hypothetical protein